MATPDVPMTSIVPKALREDNYEEWSDFVTNYLVAHDLWDVVKGTMEADFETLTKKNAAAMHAIKISCSPYILKTMVKPNIKLAKILWDELENKLRKDDKSSKDSGAVADHIQSDLVPLLKAINKGDLNAVKNFLCYNRDARSAKISFPGMKAFHVATLAGHKKIVEWLIEGMTAEELKEQSGVGDTALVIAAMNGRTDMAKILVEKEPELIWIPNGKFFPVYVACNKGHKEATHFLYSEIAKRQNIPPINDATAKNQQDFGEYKTILLNDAISNMMFDIVLDVVKNDKGAGLAAQKCKWSNQSALVTLSATPTAFLSSTRFSRWQRLIYHLMPVQPPDSSVARKYDPQMYKEPSQPVAVIMRFLEFIGIKQIYETKLIHLQSSQLLSEIFREPSRLNAEQQDEQITTSLFRAVKNGITEIVVHIIQAYPDMILKRTEKYQRDIFQYAIEKRQEKVFSLIYGLDERKVPLLTGGDSSQNNMLHIAGSLAPPTQLAHISGAALQLQRELQWFEEVKAIMNPLSKEKKNNDGETPKQVFTKNHKDMVMEGEKWMKEYATSCTIVGTLIITMMFGAAFSVPGGIDENTGSLLLRHRTSVMVYIISDAVALFTSSTSVLTFLNMLTSRYSENDFLESLPRKLMFGLFTLFCSITAMMVTFCAALTVMFDGELRVIVPIIALAGFTVAAFVILQFPLFFVVLFSTYGTIFNRKTKPWL